jgi:hypothetical protein
LRAYMPYLVAGYSVWTFYLSWIWMRVVAWGRWIVQPSTPYRHRYTWIWHSGKKCVDFVIINAIDFLMCKINLVNWFLFLFYLRNFISFSVWIDRISSRNTDIERARLLK